MSFTTVEILWALGMGTVILSTFGALFVLSLVSNQRRVFASQKEKLENAERLESFLREMPRHVLEAQERERKRVAHDLHDDIVQNIASIRFRLDNLILRPAPDGRELKDNMAELSDALEKTIVDIRRIAGGLRPLVLDDLGLLPALENLFQTVEQRSRFTIAFRCSSIHRLDGETELGVYRIIQEALVHAEQTPGTTCVKLELSAGKSSLIVRVEHDGADGPMIEPDPRRAPAIRKMAQRVMAERAQMLGGSVTYARADGCQAEIRIPLQHSSLLPQSDGRKISSP